jgi:hypothetical protein
LFGSSRESDEGEFQTYRQKRHSVHACRAGLKATLCNGLTPLAVGRRHLTQEFEFIEAFAGSFRDGTERIFGDMDRQARFFTQKLVEAAQQGSATSEDETSVNQVGG